MEIVAALIVMWYLNLMNRRKRALQATEQTREMNQKSIEEVGDKHPGNSFAVLRILKSILTESNQNSSTPHEHSAEPAKEDIKIAALDGSVWSTWRNGRTEEVRYDQQRSSHAHRH
ncbi:hypothetical protein F5Y15DRAFT_62363 [Xylariaceae sp. FL0016]|nr:hypothetical protein F5Y15DRAFT_62363 [Xylariaceae sp. FL0016]